ncbi:MAG: glycine cleavage system protein GcvH [Chitinophagales bacterium]|jgi:glycine cleavage system H protein|nr:glycine cleavage system protein GcvH [Chitinophagales bacterium]
MNVPENLKYTKDHEWVRMEENEAYVGVTDFAQSELGDIVYVDINTVGQSLARESVFGSVEAVKTVSDLFLPLSATILEVNPLLNDKPELVNQDPYGEGWMAKISIENAVELSELLDAETYSNLISK